MLRGVDINAGEQFEPELSGDLAQQPHACDRRSATDRTASRSRCSRSGAILQYLARKTGRFGGETPRERVAVSEWLFWQMGGLGPMAGQANHFRLYAAEKIPYAIDRYTDEVNRLFGVMNRRLADHEYLAGPYSIADMACVGWARGWKRMRAGHRRFPASRALAQRGAGAACRPARTLRSTYRAARKRDLSRDEEARKILFGQRAR